MRPKAYPPKTMTPTEKAYQFWYAFSIGTTNALRQWFDDETIK